MKLVDTTCPNCGASLQINPEANSMFCSYCGARLLIDDEIQHVVYDNAEEAGYQFEKGRQKAQAEYQVSQLQGNTTSGRRKRSKGKTWLWILGWLFVLPVPVTILLVRNRKLSNKTKIIIASVVWITYLLFALIGSLNPDRNTSNHDVYGGATSNIKSLEFITNDDVTLKVGDMYSNKYVHVNVSDKNSFVSEDVVFVSENQDVATISFDKEISTVFLYFNVQAVGPGDTYVYAKSADGSVTSDKIHIIVPEPIVAESIAIVDSAKELSLGESYKINVSFTPENTEDKAISWESSNENVAVVTEDGFVKTIGSGEVIITATTTNGISDSCAITVDGTHKTFELSISRVRDDDNNIGDEWLFTNTINGETAIKGDYSIAVGDTLTFYSKYTEDDTKPDIGESTYTYTVTEDDFNNGFEVSYEVNVKENGGQNSGEVALFVVTYTFQLIR